MKQTNNTPNRIPIVFTFDDNYILPACIAIKSLIETKKSGTSYDIYCIVNNISEKNRQKIERITKITWINMEDSTFEGAPYTGEYPINVYYRLVLHDLLKEYDTIIYSDVDVLFQGDLTRVYHSNLTNKYWAGVPLEKNEPLSESFLSQQKGTPSDPFYLSGHTRFKENKNDKIFASGFMVINTKKMREDNMTYKFLEIIKKYKAKLKMFDLEVLNLACQNQTILELPFDYCVLEDVSTIKKLKISNTYLFLSRIYSEEELVFAVKNPIILHYTGSNGVRVWNRKIQDQPKIYQKYYKMIESEDLD